LLTLERRFYSGGWR